jgi:hypothetical protein
MDVQQGYRHEDSEPEKNDRQNKSTDYEGKEENSRGAESSDGFYISKRTLWMVAGGAFGSLAMLGFGRAFRMARPAAVSAAKEAYGFKEWLAGKLDVAREDIEDVVAEAVFSHYKDLSATADVVKREKEILEKAERVIAERLAKAQPDKKEYAS